ncbi:ferric reductase, NAD binding domain-containing protein [Artemisia annua]|uniref:Ferric reductase, NAD binding domain-containing protein n=1 Tax=Artemisia annua TaxID=35608 RepID=A0A2U1PEQ5_ARTAN|nr:ferric reductase, NAD binding domain-containing protein [Artemisia annua]
MPRDVLLIWAVKTSEELPILHSLDLNSLFPHTKLNLEIQTYVTQETQPPPEASEVHNYVSSLVFSSPIRSGIYTLVGIGSIMWAGAYLVVPTIVSHVPIKSVSCFRFRCTHILLFGKGIRQLSDTRAGARWCGRATEAKTELLGQQKATEAQHSRLDDLIVENLQQVACPSRSDDHSEEVKEEYKGRVVREYFFEAKFVKFWRIPCSSDLIICLNDVNDAPQVTMFSSQQQYAGFYFVVTDSATGEGPLK